MFPVHQQILGMPVDAIDAIVVIDVIGIAQTSGSKVVDTQQIPQKCRYHRDFTDIWQQICNSKAVDIINPGRHCSCCSTAQISQIQQSLQILQTTQLSQMSQQFHRYLVVSWQNHRESVGRLQSCRYCSYTADNIAIRDVIAIRDIIAILQILGSKLVLSMQCSHILVP